MTWHSMRCSTCGLNWPFQGFRTCPKCGGQTRGSEEAPMDEAEAASVKAHAEFEQWLEDNGRA